MHGASTDLINSILLLEGRLDRYRERFFTLEDNILSWREKIESKTTKGELHMAQDVVDIHFNQAELEISVVTPGRTYWLQASSIRDFQKWSQHLIKFVNPYEIQNRDLFNERLENYNASQPQPVRLP